MTKLKRPWIVEYTLAPTTPAAGNAAPIVATATVCPAWSAAARTRGAMLPAPLPNCSNAAAIAPTASRIVNADATSASVISRIASSRRRPDALPSDAQSLQHPNKHRDDEARDVEPVRIDAVGRHLDADDLVALLDASLGGRLPKRTVLTCSISPMPDTDRPASARRLRAPSTGLLPVADLRTKLQADGLAACLRPRATVP